MMMRSIIPILGSEKRIRAISLLIFIMCLLSITAYLIVKYAGVGSITGRGMPAWRAFIFALASIVYMVIGLIMTVWHFLFVTLFIAGLCMIISIAKAIHRDWHYSTAFFAFLASIAHTAYFFYP